jgi:MFS family permease
LVVLLLLWASSAPSVLYPLWAARFEFSSLVQTAVYSCYPFALIVVLLVGGGISDRIGRRRTMLFGMATIAAGVVLLAFAPGLWALVLGRVLQGLGTGLALGASNASMIENEPDGDTVRASAMISVASAVGLLSGPIVTGSLVEYAPWPLHLPLSLLLVLLAGSLALLVAVRDAGGPSASPAVAQDRWRPQTISVPRDLLPVYAVAALAVTASYAAGALILSLGAQMARELVETSQALVIGALLALNPIGIGTVALFGRRLRSDTAMLVGGILASIGLAGLILTAATGSLWSFFGALGLGGFGQGLLVLGGLALINIHAPGHRRGQTLSAVYLAAYVGQGLTAVVVGLLATRLDLHRAVEIFAPVMIAACLLSAVLAVRDLRRSRPA